MNSPTSSHPPVTPNAEGTPSAGPSYTPGLSDGLGDRLLMFDTATQSSVELLRFKKEFSDSPGFEEALRARVEELAKFKHASVGSVRGVQALDDGLALVSTNTAGRRLSEMVHVARGLPFAMDLIQQLAPALAAMHQQGPRVSHGLLTAERIIITREGRLVVVEHVLASAFELLRLPATRLRTDLGIAVPSGSDPVGLNQRGDVVQLGFLALSLLLGRRLDPAHFPTNIETLLEEFTHADAAASAKLRPWLERALQLGSKPFASAQEAHAAFGGAQLDTRETRPASAATPAQHSVLAFRPADGKSKTDGPASESESKIELKPETKIEFKKDDFTPEPMKRVVDPTPLPSMASPRAKSGGSMKWILVAGVVLAIGAGAMYASGMFSKKNTPGATPTLPVRLQPAPQTAAPPWVAPTAAPAPDTKPAAGGSGTAANTTETNAASVGGAATPTRPGKETASTPPAKESTPAEKPTPAVGGFGGVKVSAPFELQVFENGTLVGSTAGPIAVLQGSHTFELVNESLAFRVRSTVNVKGGQLTPLSITPPNGRISINAVPWAEVFIDGRPAGQTPLANLAVQIGKHEVIFKHPQFGEQRQSVIVKAEGLTRISATFQQ